MVGQLIPNIKLTNVQIIKVIETYSTTMKCNIEEKLTQNLQNECLDFYSYQIIPVDLTVARSEQFRILSKVR